MGDGSANTKETTSSPGLSHFFRVNRKSPGDEVAKNISFVSNRFTLGVYVKRFISEKNPVGKRRSFLLET